MLLVPNHIPFTFIGGCVKCEINTKWSEGSIPGFGGVGVSSNRALTLVSEWGSLLAPGANMRTYIRGGECTTEHQLQRKCELTKIFFGGVSWRSREVSGSLLEGALACVKDNSLWLSSPSIWSNHFLCYRRQELSTSWSAIIHPHPIFFNFFIFFFSWGHKSFPITLSATCATRATVVY